MSVSSPTDAGTQGLDAFGEVLRVGGSEAEALPRSRVGQFEFHRVEPGPAHGEALSQARIRAICEISDKRVFQSGEMDSDLMRPAGLEFNAGQRHRREVLQGFVMRDARLP